MNVREIVTGKLSQNLISTLINLINQKRMDKVFETDLVPRLIQTIIKLDLYSNDFEPLFLAQTQAFMMENAIKQIQQIDVSKLSIYP
jgi:hypothetical protein